MKILLTTIFKDDSEYEMVRRMLSSFMPHCAGLVSVLNGPSGNFTKLKKLLKKYNAKVAEVNPKDNPQYYYSLNGKSLPNFAALRTLTFEMADTLSGYDWYTWADADDILLSGEELKIVAEKAKASNMDAVFFTYWYSIRIKPDNTFDENDIEIEHARERLLKPKMFKWVSRLHEVCVPLDGNYKPYLTQYEYDPQQSQTCVWAHITNKERVEENLKRNIKLLELQAKEEEHKDPRTIFYLAKTYYDLHTKEYDELALFLLDEYLHGQFPSGWGEERANAWQYVANIQARRGRNKEAIISLHEALKEFPNSHMHYLLLAREYGVLGQFEQSDFWLDVASRMEAPRTRTTIGNPLEIKFMLASLLYNRAIRHQKIKDAIKWAKTRMALGNLNDQDLIKMLEEQDLLNDTAKNVFNYAKWLKDNGHVGKIPALLESMPIDLGREAFASFIANEIKEPKVWPKNSIVYFASWGAEHFEPWSPKSMDKGIGGSETAVIELAKRWAKQGYDITVYGDPRDEAGDYEGVHYRPWYECNFKDMFNILILWRAPFLLDREIKARKLCMDLHDVASQLDWTEARMKKVDKVFVKSKYHRSMLPKLPDNKITVISNGINI